MPDRAYGPGRRLLAPEPVRDPADPGGVLARDDLLARGDRLGFPARGRHRYHEHHAGVGHRANARDRPAHGGRARRRHIMLQFLIEAVTLSVIGGSIGIALSVGGSELISYFAQWRTLVAPEAIALAFSFAAGIGGIFFYPARKRSEEHTSELQSLAYLVCRLLLEKKKKK